MYFQLIVGGDFEHWFETNSNPFQPNRGKYGDEKLMSRNSLAVQWLGLHAFTAKGPSSIPGWGTKIPQAV